MFQFAYAHSSLSLNRHNASSKLTDLSNDPKIQRFINNIPAKESSKREIYQHGRLRKVVWAINLSHMSDPFFTLSSLDWTNECRNQCKINIYMYIYTSTFKYFYTFLGKIQEWASWRLSIEWNFLCSDNQQFRTWCQPQWPLLSFQCCNW